MSVHAGVIATSIGLAALIIAAEKYAPLKDWLKATFTHHWLGKGALAIVLFLAVTFLFVLIRPSVRKMTWLITIEAIVVALSGVAIGGFFLLHALHLI